MKNVLDLPKIGIKHFFESTRPSLIRNLEDYHKICASTCTNLLLPYHNLNHCESTMWRVYVLSQEYPLLLQNNGERLYPILLAGLFHDADYNPKASEPENLKKAIVKMANNLKNEDEKYIVQTARLIYYTEHPSKIKVDEMPIEAQILIESDLSEVLTTNNLLPLVHRLSLELGKSPNEIMNQEIDFLDHIPVLTDGAKKIFPPLISQLKTVVNALSYSYKICV